MTEESDNEEGGFSTHRPRWRSHSNRKHCVCAVVKPLECFIVYAMVMYASLRTYFIFHLELNKIILKLDKKEKHNIFRKQWVESVWSESSPPEGAPSWAISSQFAQVCEV